MQGAPLCIGTVQTLGSSRERNGNRLGKVAARPGEEQEHPRQMQTRLFQQTGSIKTQVLPARIAAISQR